MNKRAIIWDFGGVVTNSPFDNFKEFEIRQNLPEGFIRTVNSQNSECNAWALLEKGEIDNVVLVIGKTEGHIDQSLFARVILDEKKGPPPEAVSYTHLTLPTKA